MAKRVTINDVARISGVSVATVSRVVNKNETVDPLLRSRVEKTVKELGYIPNTFAKNIRRPDNKSIAVLLPSLSNPFFAQIAEGIALSCTAIGKIPLFFSFHGDSNNELDCLKEAKQAGVSGILYCPNGEIDPRIIFTIFPKDFPLVIFYRRNVMENIPHIYQDNILGGYLATKYLLLHGRRRIVFIANSWGKPFPDKESLIQAMTGPTSGTYSMVDRLIGYEKALKEFDIPLDPSLLFFSSFSYQDGYLCSKQLLSSMIDFDAVFCGNDSVAAGVMQGLGEQGLTIPGQVSIVGFDDSVVSTITRPTLTTVKQNPKEIGLQAVEMLADIQKGQTVDERKIGVSLVVRDSTSQK